GQQYVGRLDVAVDDAVIVRVVQADGDAAQEPDGCRPAQAPLGHAAGEAAPGHVLDDHVGRPLDFAEVVDVDDVGMAHPGDRLGLVPEASDAIRVGGDRLHDLDGADPLQLGVIGAVDETHRPLADEVLDLVLSEPATGRDRHGPDYGVTLWRLSLA